MKKWKRCVCRLFALRQTLRQLRTQFRLKCCQKSRKRYGKERNNFLAQYKGKIQQHTENALLAYFMQKSLSVFSVWKVSDEIFSHSLLKLTFSVTFVVRNTSSWHFCRKNILDIFNNKWNRFWVNESLALRARLRYLCIYSQNTDICCKTLRLCIIKVKLHTGGGYCREMVSEAMGISFWTGCVGPGFLGQPGSSSFYPCAPCLWYWSSAKNSITSLPSATLRTHPDLYTSPLISLP